MAKKILKKICDFYDWDVEVVRIILSALKFVSKCGGIESGFCRLGIPTQPLIRMRSTYIECIRIEHLTK
jgi:hypothetical protein